MVTKRDLIETFQRISRVEVNAANAKQVAEGICSALSFIDTATDPQPTKFTFITPHGVVNFSSYSKDALRWLAKQLGEDPTTVPELQEKQ